MTLGFQAQAPATPQATPAIPQADLQGLQARYLDLKTRVAVLEAQRDVIAERTGSDNPAMRSEAEKTLLSLDLDLAKSKAELTTIQQQLGIPTQTEAIVQAPPPLPTTWADRVDPDTFNVMLILSSLAILIPLSLALGKRLLRTRPARATSSSSSDDDKIAPRLDRLEQAVDAIAIEMERVSESQRFVAKVLSERPASAPPAAAAKAADVPLAEKPFLALGAGPMEQIRTPERQGVKASITPH